MAPNTRGALLVMQSGGPTAVINASLAGIVEEAQRRRAFSRILGANHATDGLLEGRFLDLSAQPRRIWPAIARTPGAALGTSRRKLLPENTPAVLEILARNGVSALIVIGGNDSAENAHALAAAAGKQLSVLHVPKTVDNDLVETDHCPGYGSAARFIALAVMGAGRDAEAMGSTRPLTIVEVMGRNAGWLPLAACLGKREERDAPHIVCSPERPLDVDWFIARVDEAIRRHGFAVAVVGETVRGPDGPLGHQAPEYTDEFGHAYYPSPADFLAHTVAAKLKVRTKAERPGTIQRSFAGARSRTDAAEAYLVGQMAVRALIAGKTDVMVSLVRQPGMAYRCTTGLVPLGRVGGKERPLPASFADAHGLATPAFLHYASPLIGAPLPRFARISLQ